MEKEAVADIRAWIADSPNEIETEPTTAGMVAAYEVLESDPDKGAGNPRLLQRAADAARMVGDAPLADWIEMESDAWSGYLVNLTRAIQR